MKILFLRNNAINPDVRVEKEVRALLGDGFCVSGFCWDKKGENNLHESRHYPEGVFDIQRVYYKYSPGAGVIKNIFSFLRFQIAILVYLYKHRTEYDVVHACDLDTAFSAKIVCSILKKTYIYDIFDYFVDCYNISGIARSIIEKIDHGTIKHAYATIICSEERVKQIGLLDWPFIVLHNSPILNDVDLEIEKQSDGIVKIGYVGLLHKKRQLDKFAECIRCCKDVELHIGGFGQLEEFFNNASKENDCIHYYGKMSYEDTLKLESKCDALLALYPIDNINHVYAAPNKFYEALMLGKPLIMIRGSGMSQIVSDNNYGIIIDSVDQTEVCRLIDEIRNSSFDEEGMRALFENKYQWSIMGERLCELYRSITSS